MKNNVKIIPLGGIRESGENLYAVDINNGIYVLDCGSRYPNNEMLGIDLIIPNFAYLRKNRQRIVGVFLTHAHWGAMGALPYFLSEFNVPVFGSKFTIELAKAIVHKYHASRYFNQFHAIDENSEIIFHHVTITFFRTTHSIPGSIGIVLNTKAGRIVYTGDFKFDPTVPAAYRTDVNAISRVGQKGVLALLSDSECAENFHPSVHEDRIEEYLIDTFRDHNNRIIVGSMVANLLRFQQILNAANLTHRKIYVAPSSANDVLKIALLKRAVKLPARHLLVSWSDLKHYPASRQLILQTGKMGEPLLAIQRMAEQRGRIKIKPSDFVLLATTPSHSIEVRVAETKDSVYRASGRVRMISDEMPVSENASRTDLQLLMNLMKPKYLIPVEGEYRMLQAHTKLALAAGMPKSRVIIPTKGQVISYNGNKMAVNGEVPAGNVIVDGSGVGDVGNIVLRDRRVLSEEGIFIAVVTIDHQNRCVVSQPKITSRGFIYVKTNKDLMNHSVKLVDRAVQNDLDHDDLDWGHLKQSIRDVLNSYLYSETHRHPVIMPVIMEINRQ